MSGVRGVVGLVLLLGGAAMAIAVGGGWDPLAALAAWAGSASVTPPIVGGKKANDPGNGGAHTSGARTSGGKTA